MGQIFISHSTDDDAIVRALQRALGDLDLDAWIDSRGLRGGDPLWPEIQKAIESAEAYAVLVSPSGLQSSWIGDELDHAIEVQKRRGQAAYPVIPLSLDGTKLGVLKKYFGHEPLYIPLRSAPGGIEAALDAILVALGKRAPVEVAPTPQPPAQPLQELVLELTDLRLEQIQPGVHRATARAHLVYEPATAGQRAVKSAQTWRFVAPLGPLEADDLRWYLEKYAIWPSDVFRPRARKVEDNLVTWGRQLYDAAMPSEATDGVLRAWARTGGHAGRRFSVHVDPRPLVGAHEADAAMAREAATLLLGLPWELLHDGDSFLFQGARPTRVRRRLPNTRDLDLAVVATPIRILLICARPEDAACRYFDHRASALPLVDAMEELPGLVQLRILAPPTLPALREELDRARREGEPYHVLHFDGHGVYDRRVGLGGLCFEHPGDEDRLVDRRHETIFTSQLGPLLRDHRIPLVYLDACQTAQAEQASESVAAEMLQRGVASVVAMSHSVLVETARRFVTAFYAALARGDRVGDAMLEGQRRLKDDTLRGRIFGVGELRLEDWFVPVLFQEEDDPQLFQQAPAQQTRDDFQEALKSRLGELPPPPPTGFIGRSRDLLALERLLHRERYAVLRGQGGEGKTALAAELARWMVRSQRFRRAAFVSVEAHGTARAVLDALGRQLVPGYSVATFASAEQAEQPVARALREQPTVLVVDNLESILQPPYLADMPDALAEDAHGELVAILALCARLHRHGETRLVFTSREALPAPFDGEANRRELHRLHRDDAVKLVERVVNQSVTTAGVADAERAAIEDLVEAVHGHARTLALLAPALKHLGVTATREALVELLVDMDRRFPGQRERSLFASVELSLRRLSPEARDKARVLGVFHSGVNLSVLGVMMGWDNVTVNSLAGELVDTGLATYNDYAHFSLDPALCPYLRNLLDEAKRNALTARWVEAMHGYVYFLGQQRNQSTELAATLTLLELPNLLALLAHVAHDAEAEATVDLAADLQGLLENRGRPRLLARIGEVRDAATARISATWSHARFQAEDSRINEQLASGRLREALAGAQALLRKAQAAGEHAYANADYDLAMACFTLGRVLKQSGSAQEALPQLDEAQRRLAAVAQAQPGMSAAHMASICLTQRGDCLRRLGRLVESAAAYEESIRQAEHSGDARGMAVAKLQLGSVRLQQHRYQDALGAYAEAREQFTRMGEPRTVAVVLHQVGIAYHSAGQPNAAEDAYRQSLAISVRLGDVGGQADTLMVLGNLYHNLGRLEDAASLYRTAGDHFVTLGDALSESHSRNNLADTLSKLRCWGEARQQIRRAIECGEPFGHAAESWTAWAILADIEAGDDRADLAAQAKAKAHACYLAYRLDGGENQNPDGRISLTVTAKLVAGDAAGAISDLDELLAHLELPDELRPFVVALRAIAAGSRDPGLADAPDLHYRSAAELRCVLDTLEAQNARTR